MTGVQRPRRSAREARSFERQFGDIGDMPVTGSRVLIGQAARYLNHPFIEVDADDSRTCTELLAHLACNDAGAACEADDLIIFKQRNNAQCRVGQRAEHGRYFLRLVNRSSTAGKLKSLFGH